MCLFLVDKAEVTGTEERRKIDVFGAAGPAPAPRPKPSTPAPAPTASEPADENEVVEEVLSHAKTAPAQKALPEAEAESPSKAEASASSPAPEPALEPAPAPTPEPSPEPAAEPAIALAPALAVEDDSLEVEPLPDEADELPPADDLATGSGQVPASAATPVVMTVVAKATVRDGPRLSATAIGDLRIGQTVQVLEQAEHDGHMRVRIASLPDGTQAWCSRRTRTRALLEVADRTTPVPDPYVRKTRTNSKNADILGAAVKGALLGASEAAIRQSLNQTNGSSAASTGSGREAAGGEQLEAKVAAAKAAREEARAAAAAKKTFRYRLIEAVRTPPRAVVVGLGSMFAGAVLGPGYISWRCSTLELQSQLACDTAKAEALSSAVDAGDAMVNAPLLLCFLLSLGYLTNRQTDAENVGASGNSGSSSNAALATMASMGPGADQRQMQRLIEGGTSVMSGLASVKNLVDDAAGELTHIPHRIFLQRNVDC